ncbi:MAG: hypothetical protein K5767_03345, partial [Clostridia bacterium]|nr:hypothetical protein [Clostridia bacterium]
AAIALVLTLQVPVFAMESGKKVSVSLPTFDVTLNGTKIESAYDQYPLIVYKDITYFPMTYHGSRFMHLKANWYEVDILPGVLFVGYSNQSESEWTPYITNAKNKITGTAVVSNARIAVNTLDDNLFIDNEEEIYPVLNFRGVTYFPLTWRFAKEEFGWDYSFDAKTGLTINSTEQFRPELEDKEQLSTISPTRGLKYKFYVYDDANTEYVGYPHTNLFGASFCFRHQGEEIVSFPAEDLLDDGEYLFNISLDQNGKNIDPQRPPTLSNGVLTICAVHTDNEGRNNVLLKINLREHTVLSAEE